MFVEPGAPGGAQRIARLQHPAQPRAGAAANQAEMPAALMRHQLENDARLAMALDAEHDGFVRPLHGLYLVRLSSSAKADDKSLFRKFQAHFPVTLRIVLPALADLDVEEQVYRVLDNFGDVGARRRPDRLDRLARFTEHDLTLAFARDIDRLLDAHRAVAQFLPDL